MRPGMRYTIDINGDLRDCYVFDHDSDLQRCDPPRTKRTHPYSYDPFTVWGGPSKKCTGSVYTDRMSCWKPDAYREIGDRIFGKGRWFGEGCNGQKIEQFLQEYNENPRLRLLRVVEYCNASSGYPTWRLDYYEESK